MSKLYDKSKHLSYLLRHNPEDLIMDISGFVYILDLIRKLNITESELYIIVETDNKGRFGYNENKTKIRALQGLLHHFVLGSMVNVEVKELLKN